MSNDQLERTIVLANSARLPLGAVAIAYGLLSSHLADPDSDWDVVYHLRQVCLGHPIEPEQTRALIREKVLMPDGSLDPVLEAVVLSSVRGEGRNLHLDSPFTDSLDRAMAEFINAREYIRSRMEVPEAEGFIADDPTKQIRDSLRSKKWTDDRKPPSDEFPPH
jgi:hypothetical protein